MTPWFTYYYTVHGYIGRRHHINIRKHNYFQSIILFRESYYHIFPPHTPLPVSNFSLIRSNFNKEDPSDIVCRCVGIYSFVHDFHGLVRYEVATGGFSDHLS